MLSNPWAQTRKQATNLSSSKAMYGFSKDKRFKNAHNILCDSFYNIPSSIGRSQASGIGRGNKITLVTNTIAPAPSKYDIKSQFDSSKRGGKFSLGREKIKYGGVFVDNHTPEPGHYEIRGSLGTKRGFSIYSKLPPPQFSNSKNPGPGQYNSLTSLNQTGRYHVSTFPNCQSYKIKPTKLYDPAHCNVVPGPGHYDQQKQNMNVSGLYFNSKRENSRCRTFSKSEKKGLVTLKKIPGPGAYNFYSEFGAKPARL